MKKALISPNEFVQYLSEWKKINDKKYLPIYSTCGVRVAEVANVEFEVAKPLFWVECEDEVTAEQYHYDEELKQIIKTPEPAPYPVEDEATNAQSENNPPTGT